MPRLTVEKPLKEMGRYTLASYPVSERKDPDFLRVRDIATGPMMLYNDLREEASAFKEGCIVIRAFVCLLSDRSLAAEDVNAVIRCIAPIPMCQS